MSNLNDVDFDDSLFDGNTDSDWIEDSSSVSSSSKGKRYSARRKVKDITMRPFKCPFCDMAFPQSAGLSRHRKVVHGICRGTEGVLVMKLASLNDSVLDISCSNQNQMLHEALFRGLSALSKEELLLEFKFLNAYLVEIQEQLLRKEMV